VAENRQKAAQEKVPVTRHPLFPAVAALWFGALFGLGSLAIRPGLIEGLVLQFGIDTLVPAAAPPLGVTARILIALALAVAGGMLGASIARKLAHPVIKDFQRKRGAEQVKVTPQRRARDAHPDAPMRRPVSVLDEIGTGEVIETANAEPVTIVAPLTSGRRSALVFDAGKDEFSVPDTAPLPGGLPQIFELQSLHAVDQPDADIANSPVTEPAALDLEPFNQTEAATAETEAPMLAEPAAADFAQAPRQVFGQAAVRAFGDLSIPAASPIDFAHPQQVAREAIMTQDDESECAEAAPTFLQPASAAAASASNSAPDSLDALDLVGLTQRFAESLKRRREQAAISQALAVLPEIDEAAPLTLPSFAAAEPVQSDLTDDTGEALASTLPLLVLPAALQPLNLDQFDDDDEDYSNLLPLRRIAMPPQPATPVPVAFEPEQTRPEPALQEVAASTADESLEADENESEGESEYCSLLDLNRDPAPRQQFVRIEAPVADSAVIEPVVIFPGQALGQFPAPADRPAEGAQLPFAVQAVAASEPLRKFDAPGSAVTGQAVTGQMPHTDHDPEETERALRAALASLQRMSGAA
jgi:hypothetical protein